MTLSSASQTISQGPGDGSHSWSTAEKEMDFLNSQGIGREEIQGPSGVPKDWIEKRCH